jgi:type III secretion protein V
MAIGILRNKMPAAQAAEVYSILSVGDGLVSQIPALLITLASGILVTRVESKDKTKNLGFSVKEELFANAKVLNIGAGLMICIGMVPGLPFLPFFVCALGAAAISASATFMPLLAKSKKPGAGTLAKQLAFKEKLDKKVQEAKQQKSLSDRLSPSVVPIGVDLDPVLSNTLGFSEEENDDSTELMATLIPQLRDALYLETGVRFPGVRVRPHVKSMPTSSFCVRLNDVPVLQERVLQGHVLATTNPEKLLKLAVVAKPTQHPISKNQMSLIEESQRAVVEAAGITVWSAGGIVSLYLASALRKRAKEFVGLQEVSETIDRLEKAYPALVKEVIPKVATIPQMVNVLRRLVDEGVSIRDLKTIVEAMGEFGTRDGDGLFLTEKVRAALSAQLAYSYAGMDNHLPVVLLDPVIEDTIASGIAHSAHGQTLSLDPEICRTIITTVAQTLQPVVAKGKRPVVLTNSEIRRFVRKLLETDLPQVAVLSFDELPAELTIQPMGRAQLAAGV